MCVYAVLSFLLIWAREHGLPELGWVFHSSTGTPCKEGQLGRIFQTPPTFPAQAMSCLSRSWVHREGVYDNGKHNNDMQRLEVDSLIDSARKFHSKTEEGVLGTTRLNLKP